MYRNFIKRLLDLIFALTLSVPALPVLFIAAVLTRLSSKGSSFFVQQRPGKYGRIFKIYKLRTMTLETDSSGRLLPDMQRITKVGNIFRKLSIDELPQLLNIIKGEMSFIGPRPLLVQYLEHYTPEQMKRHDVLPGITGWAQVNGRNAISWEDKFTLDVWYVNNISILLDIKIVLKTIKNIVAKKDINNSSGDTMPAFTGNLNQKVQL
ncbi:putative sugar transferase EpsL [Ruminiclostridium hungatei]|uniref:Putative sugar transferase EpsL n=1 Tax=Ruminiclostridium hungatei TaxID=48256 RepID=A0A1V4SI34_RUMHU|nr:sugar transferase [Ruminiclostridium hungatei]OPX43558.1 putative sugar transferase EpsL [Ruminiclostridium hungatei]